MLSRGGTGRKVRRSSPRKRVEIELKTVSRTHQVDGFQNEKGIGEW